MRLQEVTEAGSFYTFQTNNKLVKNQQDKEIGVWDSTLMKQ